MAEIKKEPCLVEARQGFYVVYQEKFLYSKYEPEKSILQKLEKMTFLPGTLVLVNSAVLDYGLKELCRKLPESCAVILCEADDELRDFEKENRNLDFENDTEFKELYTVTKQEMYNLPVILQKDLYIFENGKKCSFAGNFRRVLRIDFSAGVQFHSDFYSRLESACVNAIKQFWMHRFTLAKFGRKYSRNLFRNLHNLQDSVPLSKFIRSVSQPIFVFGSGESAEDGINRIKQIYDSKSEKPFILCADTAFSMLKTNGIIPDGIVIDEAQSIIVPSFLGVLKFCGNKVTVFQSLCYVPCVAGKSFPKNQISYYATDYSPGSFFENLKKSLFYPPVLQAFGSVGITAFILAYLFRKNENVPVNYYGLDFAFSAGKTHAKGTPSHQRQLKNLERIKCLENFNACFGDGAVINSENEKYPYTTPILKSYKETFNQVEEQADQIAFEIEKAYSEKEALDLAYADFFINERNALMELRNILSGNVVMSENKRYEKITSLLENRQYLYLHFPDGYKFSMELNFLKRVRGEIDGFLKWV